MSIVGTVESLWRYPVKSMRGEEVDELFAGFSGIYGDRLFAFESSAAPRGFPFFTGRENGQMIRYRPRFRQPEKAARPVNWTEAQQLFSRINPLSASPDELMIDVETPDGQVLAIDDPALIDHLRDGARGKHQLKLLRSEKAMTDCRPISLLSIQTAQQLAEETGVHVDQRCFRANIYVNLASAAGFAENAWLGASLRLGEQVVVSIGDLVGRCTMITLDPDTAETAPAVLKAVTQRHDRNAGIYGAVLVEGIVRKGDPVELVQREVGAAGEE